MVRSRGLATALVANAFLVQSSCVTSSVSTQETDAAVPQWESVPVRFAIEPDVPIDLVRFSTTEGTWMSVDVSPDGNTVVFDLLGDLYQLPIEGGDAVPLTTGVAWDQTPLFSPDGAHIYFVSDRKGYKNLWRLSLVDQSLQQITQLEADVLGGPNWSSDKSRLLVGVANRPGTSPEVILHAIDPLDGAVTPIESPDIPLYDAEARRILRYPWKVFSGVESSDGKVFFSQSQPALDDYGSSVTRLSVFDRKSQARTPITQPNATYHEHKPQLSQDGSLLAYFRQYSEHRAELRILDRRTGEDRSLVELTDVGYPGVLRRADSLPNYAFTPDSESVVFWHAGKIRRVELVDGSLETIPFRATVEREVKRRTLPIVESLNDSADTIRWPSLSADGQVMAFSAFGYVWTADMSTGRARRLSDTSDIEYMPAISPDGQSVAYVSFGSSGDEFGRGRLMVADIEGREHREVLADKDADYILPQWSHDGSMIALIREPDRRRGVNSSFGWTYSAEGAFHEVATATSISDYAKLFIYSRQVKFDIADKRLIFSYPRSRTETVLMSAGLGGEDSELLATGTPEVGGITPASDLNHLSLTRRDGSVWVLPFKLEEGETTVSTSLPEAYRVSRSGGYYVDWRSPEDFTFGVGKDMYRYSLDDGELQSLVVKVDNPKAPAEKPIAFVGARLVTMSDGSVSESVVESGTVVVDGTRIAAVGAVGEVKIPRDAWVIDVTGKTILPGLLDTHYHGMSERSRSGAVALPSPDIGDLTAIKFGITSAWSPGGMVDDAVPAIADLQRAGRLPGPRLSHAAVGAIGHPYETLVDYAAVLSSVSLHRELGVDVLKEYNAHDRQQRRWLSSAAYESGLGIVSHLDTFDGTMTRIIDGYTGGDHPSFPDISYRDVHELLRQTGFIWTPNIVITAGVDGTLKDMELFFCRAIREEEEQGNIATRVVDSICEVHDGDSPTVSYDDHRVVRIAESVALAARKGVTIGVSAHNDPGHNLHREMWLMWKGGMSIEDILRATVNVNAEKLGLHEEIGTLEVGKLADFLVLDRNPLDNILNTLSITHTVQGGTVFDSASGERVNAPAAEAVIQRDGVH